MQAAVTRVTQRRRNAGGGNAGYGDGGGNAGYGSPSGNAAGRQRGYGNAGGGNAGYGDAGGNAGGGNAGYGDAGGNAGGGTHATQAAATPAPRRQSPTKAAGRWAKKVSNALAEELPELAGHAIKN